MKKLLSLLLIIFLLSGCTPEEKKNEKLTVCATLFPQYDFCKSIAGDKAEVKLLLPPGMESHSFEPGVKDIRDIWESDIFIYTGASMEPWAENIINGVDVKIVDVSENINLCAHEHNTEEHHHDHGDPHIWTSPENALIMVENILNALCERDPQNADYYKDNAQKYFLELEKLDTEFRELGERSKGITLCHGGKFAMSYLEKNYGFTFLSAYDSCSSSAEPSVMRVKEIIDTINAQNLSGVFYEELNEGRVAKTISNETGAEMLLLHTCHNLTFDEIQKGESYISLMQKNADNIRKVILCSQ